LLSRTTELNPVQQFKSEYIKYENLRAVDLSPDNHAFAVFKSLIVYCLIVKFLLNIVSNIYIYKQEFFKKSFC